MTDDWKMIDWGIGKAMTELWAIGTRPVITVEDGELKFEYVWVDDEAKKAFEAWGEILREKRLREMRRQQEYYGLWSTGA